MGPLFLGILLLAALIFFAQWFGRTEPARAAQALKWTLGAAAVGVAIFLAATGRLAGAVAAIAALAPLLLHGRSLWRRVKSAGGPSGGQRSTVETAMLRMILDHDSGTIAGDVMAGEFKGRKLEDLSLSNLLDLLGDCRSHDPQAASLLEAYLDKRFGDSWRQSGRQSGRNSGQGGGQESSAARGRTAMTREEAYEILGLAPGATENEIKAAYHRLMLKLHPDQGGSNYLAAKINQARDILL